MGRIPALAKWLGYAGLVPQLVSLGLLLRGPSEWHDRALAFGIVYAALALVFAGGAWWGLAAAAPAAERRRSLGWLWVAAALAPALAICGGLAFASGVVPAEPILVGLGAALLVSLGVDARLGPLAPPWWMALRVPLAIVLGAATLGLAFLAPA